MYLSEVTSKGDGELGDGANGGSSEAGEAGRRAAVAAVHLEQRSGACEARRALEVGGGRGGIGHFRR